MSAETTSSTLSELYTEIVAEALFVASERSIMRPLVKNYAITGGGKSVEVPVYGTVSASAVAEASDLSNTAINPTSVTISASENGIMTTLTDLARNSAPRNVAGDIGKLFGEAIAKKNRHRPNSIIWWFFKYCWWKYYSYVSWINFQCSSKIKSNRCTK